MDKIVFVLLGKTGSGKSTILNMIQDVHGVDLPKLASYTSRPRRSNEEKSNEYIFLDNSKFDEMVANGCFMEHRKYTVADGSIWQYGTGFPDSDYSITTMTPDVVPTVKNVAEIKVYPIYIDVSQDIRYKRMKFRESQMETPNYSEMVRRYISDEKRYTQKMMEDAGINDTNTFNNNGFAFNTCRDILLYIDNIISEDKRERMTKYASN